MDIRVATMADLAACASVQKRSALAGYAHIFPPDDYPFPDDAVRSEWVRRLRSGVWVATAAIDDEVVGTVSVRADRVEALFVVPEHWRTGVAAGLHDAALGRLVAAGHRVARLDVMADNTRARRFYERRGWAPDGRRGTAPFPPYPLLLGYRRDLCDVSRSVT